MGDDTTTDIELGNPETKMGIDKMVLKHMKENPAILMIGHRSCGKTCICRDIAIALNNAKKFDECIIFSNFESYEIDKFGKNAKLYANFSPDKLQEILDFQTARSAQAAASGAKCPRIFIIFDDCLYNTVNVKCEQLKTLASTHSQNNIGFIISGQFYGMMPLGMREHADYVFLGRDQTVTGRNKLYEYYGQIFPSFDAFRIYFEQLTQNWEMMVFDRTSTGSSLKDYVFWYRAIIQNNPNAAITFLTRAYIDIYMRQS